MKELYGGSLYLSDWLGKNSIANLREEVLALDWITKRTARHEYFMSVDERGYSYGNSFSGEEEYFSKPMTLAVDAVMLRLNEDLGANFNACFLNKYDDEKQHLGWHADDFEGMNPNEPIAVVSLGAEREIWLKKQDEKGNIPSDQKVLLEEGSLFVMPEGFQDEYFHRIPKHDRPCGWRISLTFRSFK